MESTRTRTPKLDTGVRRHPETGYYYNHHVPNGLYVFNNAPTKNLGQSRAPSHLTDHDDRSLIKKKINPNKCSSDLTDDDDRSVTSMRKMSPEKCLTVTLMFSRKAGDKLLFLEAGKDFVDIILGLLTVPLGSLLRLLSSRARDHDDVLWKLEPGIFNVFRSVEKLEDADQLCTDKSNLLEPQPVPGFASKLLQMEYSDCTLDASQARSSFSSSSSAAPLPSPSSLYSAPSLPSSSPACGTVYYSCGTAPRCVYITRQLGQRCPLHGRRMRTLCRYVDDNSEIPLEEPPPPVTETGYVKEGTKFFITDSLDIFAPSQSFRLETMSVLKSVELFVGMEEILKLLRVSFTSSTVLRDVFGKEIEENVASDAPPPLVRKPHGHVHQIRSLH